MEDKYTKEELRSIRIGIISLCVILVAVFITVSHNASIERKGLGKTYNVYASFGRTDGLNVGDAVRLSGVDIGRAGAMLSRLPAACAAAFPGGAFLEGAAFPRNFNPLDERILLAAVGALAGTVFKGVLSGFKRPVRGGGASGGRGWLF